MSGRKKLSLQTLTSMPLMAIVMMIIILSSALAQPSSFRSLTGEKSDNDSNDFLSFSVEPPEIFEFSNSTGAQIDCKAQGKSKPIIAWKSSEGLPIKNVRGLRHVTTDGTLVFEPFKAEDYRQDIHDVRYTCSATNSLGTILSKEVKIRAVIVQPYDVYVYDTHVVRGNDAVIKCHLPNILSSYINVTSWLRDDRYIINNTGFNNDNKYVVLPEGELLIRNVDDDDHGSKYKCKTFHKLSKIVKMSTTQSTLFVNAPQTNIAPSVVYSMNSMKVVEGETLVLPCIVQGTPVPEVKWVMKESLELVSLDHYTYPGAMIIESIHHTQAGQYRCMVKNVIGEEMAATDVMVDVPLSVKMIPSKIKSELHQSVILTCEVSGKPIYNSLYWLKNGEKILEEEDIIINAGSLTIVRMNLKHKGIYQCFVGNNRETVHAQGIVQLGDVPPDLQEIFTEQTLSEGDSLSLRCRTAGTPLPKITWTIDNDEPIDNIQSQSLSDGSIISWMNITSVHNKDGGVYTCKATNKVGNAHHVAKINVYGPLTARANSNLEGVAGEEIVFNCPVFGYPVNTFKWYKDEHMLPFNQRQLIWKNGTFLLKDLRKNMDSGRYDCIAENDKGEKAKGTIQLSVRVPPKIIGFSFQDDQFFKGMRAHIICAVSQGDLPIEFMWVKDGQSIPPALGVVTRNIDGHANSLSIESVSSGHTGNYTCIASNAVAKVSHTAQLLVYVPSHWKLMPDDQVAVKGKPLTIDCQAEGVPDPKISWQKELGIGITDKGKFITASSNIYLLQNSSLHFKNISMQDQGYYYCNGNNGIENELSRRFSIKVQVPTHFKLSTTIELAKIKGEATLTCDAFGDLPVALHWFHEKRKIDAAENTRFKMLFANSTKAEPSVHSELIINPVSKEDKGSYTCSAHNIHGNASRVIRLVVQEPPSPTKIILTYLGNRSVEVTWTKPFDGESAIVKYILQHKRKHDYWSPRTFTKSFDAITTTTTIRNLQPATVYEFRVAAENDVGRGNFSEIVTIIMGEEAPEGSPLQVKVETFDPQSFRISWKPPKKSLWNGVIRGYYIGYKVHESNEDYRFKNLEVPENYTNDIIYQLNNLKMYTQYSIIIQAYNNAGRGPSSQEIVVMTSEDTPRKPPQQIRCSSLSSRSIYVTWKSPPSDAILGILKGYKVIYQAVKDRQNSRIHSNTSLIPQITLNNLEVDTNYSIQVLAFTKMGDGVRSGSVFCKTYEDVPGSPELIKALPASKTSVLVAWKSPHRSSSAVTKYNIYYTTTENDQKHKDFSNKQLEGVNVVTVEGNDEFHEIQGLKENTCYAFWITALSSIGEGPFSTVVTQAPTEEKTAAALASFDDVIKTKWKKDILLSCRMFGNPFPDREWFRRGQLIQQNERISVRLDGTLVITKSEKEDGGNYTCKVSNSLGQDEIQYSVFVVVPPGSPIIDVLSKSLTSIRLRWDVEDDGGSSVQGFFLYYQRQSGKWEKKEISTDKETFTLENLACGSTYQIYMEAFNEVGIGKPCDMITVTTYGEVFQVPSKENLIKEGATFITIHFEAWPSGGCPIQYFVAEFKQLTATEWRVVSDQIKPTKKKLVVPGLSPATWYVLRLTAYTSGEDPNIAEYVFGTLTIGGGTLPPNVHKPEERVVMFYLDPWIFIPIIGLLIIIIIASVIVFIYCKRKTPRQSQPTDWTQYAGTLARARELGVSVESFVPMTKGGANSVINDYESIRPNSPGFSSYSTIPLPAYTPEMTFRRQRTASIPNRQFQEPFCEPLQNNMHGDEKVANNPFFNGENQLHNRPSDVEESDNFGSKTYGRFPLQIQDEFVHEGNYEYLGENPVESNA